MIKNIFDFENHDLRIAVEKLSSSLGHPNNMELTVYLENDDFEYLYKANKEFLDNISPEKLISSATPNPLLTKKVMMFTGLNGFKLNILLKD